jgi:hypothetical protein
MLVHYPLVRMMILSLLVLTGAAVAAFADCTDWERDVLLRKTFQCSPFAIQAICAGERPMPNTPDCGEPQARPESQGDLCLTPVGRCQLSSVAPLRAMCQCQTPGGYVNGWVARE